MLTRSQEKEIRALQDNHTRWERQQCLVEGKRFVDAAGQAVQFVFTPADTPRFSQLVTTDTPQDIAAVARIPQWTIDNVCHQAVVVLLDRVQDPGNVGSALRLCQAFDASLVLVDCADVSNAKVIRSSAGAFFSVAWMRVTAANVQQTVLSRCGDRTIYRLEKRDNAVDISTMARAHSPILLVVGSEAHGIQLDIQGTSLVIPQNDSLESLNVTHALAIALYLRYAALH